MRIFSRHSCALRLWLVACLAWMPLASWAKSKIVSPKQRYDTALRNLRAVDKGEVEPVFRLGLAAADKLQEAIMKADEAGKELPEETKKLEGFAVSTQEALYVVPEPEFFLELAKKKGTPVDVAFFENLQRTYPSFPAWPVYIEQQTDYSGCNRYEAPELISVYQGWTEFAAKNPKAYVAEVARQLSRIEELMTASTCACGNQAQVTGGFEAFLKAFPKASIAPKVRVRLEALKAGKSDLRFECHSG